VTFDLITGSNRSNFKFRLNRIVRIRISRSESNLSSIKTEFFRKMLDSKLSLLRADSDTIYEFQQDNARPHTAKRTAKFLEELARKHGLTIMNWTTNSPDLSPIENLWPHLKHELRKQYPDTATLKGSPETIRTKLQE
jgi:transposase